MENIGAPGSPAMYCDHQHLSRIKADPSGWGHADRSPSTQLEAFEVHACQYLVLRDLVPDTTPKAWPTYWKNPRGGAKKRLLAHTGGEQTKSELNGKRTVNPPSVLPN
jgi:hypothetical protein